MCPRPSLHALRSSWVRCASRFKLHGVYSVQCVHGTLYGYARLEDQCEQLLGLDLIGRTAYSAVDLLQPRLFCYIIRSSLVIVCITVLLLAGVLSEYLVTPSTLGVFYQHRPTFMTRRTRGSYMRYACSVRKYYLQSYALPSPAFQPRLDNCPEFLGSVHMRAYGVLSYVHKIIMAGIIPCTIEIIFLVNF